jgi:hypothetical protein
MAVASASVRTIPTLGGVGFPARLGLVLGAAAVALAVEPVERSLHDQQVQRHPAERGDHVGGVVGPLYTRLAAISATTPIDAPTATTTTTTTSVGTRRRRLVAAQGAVARPALVERADQG